jgi:chorismate mutase
VVCRRQPLNRLGGRTRAPVGSPTVPREVRGVRGATTLDRDDAAQLRDRVPQLIQAMLDANGLSTSDVISIWLTGTPDITCGFPAAAARALDLADTPLLGAQELDVPGAVPLCVRVLMHVHTDAPKRDVRHVYLWGAEALRPDLAGEDGVAG